MTVTLPIVGRELMHVGRLPVPPMPSRCFQEYLCGALMPARPCALRVLPHELVNNFQYYYYFH